MMPAPARLGRDEDAVIASTSRERATERDSQVGLTDRPLDEHSLLALQRTAGNRATAQLAVQRLAISDEHGTRQLPDKPKGPGAVTDLGPAQPGGPKVGLGAAEGASGPAPKAPGPKAPGPKVPGTAGPAAGAAAGVGAAAVAESTAEDLGEELPGLGPVEAAPEGLEAAAAGAEGEGSTPPAGAAPPAAPGATPPGDGTGRLANTGERVAKMAGVLGGLAAATGIDELARRAGDVEEAAEPEPGASELDQGSASTEAGAGTAGAGAAAGAGMAEAVGASAGRAEPAGAGAGAGVAEAPGAGAAELAGPAPAGAVVGAARQQAAAQQAAAGTGGPGGAGAQGSAGMRRVGQSIAQAAGTMGRYGALGGAPGLAAAGDAQAVAAASNDLLARMPAPSPLGTQRVQRLPEVEVPTAPAVTMPEAPDAAVDTGAMSSAASAVNVQGSASGDESIADWLISQATAAFQSLVGDVHSDAGTAGSDAGTTMSGAASSLFGEIGTLAASIESSLTSGFEGMLSGQGSVLNGILREVKAALKAVLREAAGSVKGLQGSIKSTLMEMIQSAQGNPVERIRQMIQEEIDGVIQGVADSVTAQVAEVAASVTDALSELEALIAAIGPQLEEFVSSAEAQITEAITSVQEMVDGFLTDALAAVQEVPDAVRSLVESLINTLRGAVDRFAAGLRAAAQNIAASIRSAITQVSEFIAEKAELAKAALADLVAAVAENANAIIHQAIDLAIQIGRSIASAAMSAGEKAVKWLILGLPGLLLEYAIEKASPYVVGWIMEALDIDLSDLPVRPENPGQIAQQAGQMAQQAASSASADIANGLLNPEGDHIARGIYVTGSYTQPSGGASGSVGLQVTLDLVTNYVTNQLGLYASAGVAGGIGASTSGGFGAETGVTSSWGTVMTFGREADGKPKDIKNFEGRFFNVGASVGGGGPVEGVPVAVSTGSTIYMSGAITTAGTPGTSTPGTTTPGTPGTATPGTSTPGTPGGTTPGGTAPGTVVPAHPLGTFAALFASQSADPGANPAGAVTAAVNAMRADVAGQPDDHFRVDVVGRSSNRWQAAGDDENQRVSNNQALSEQRATVIAGQVDANTSGLPVGPASHHGDGVRRAAGDRTTNNPDDRRADIAVTVEERTTPSAPTPGTTTPGTPGTSTPGSSTPGTPGTSTPGTSTPGTGPQSNGLNTGGEGPLGLWGPQTSGGTPLVGWDSTLNVGVSTSSKEANAGAGVQVGDSYSWPLLKPPAQLSPEAMLLVRVLMGLSKLVMDVTSLSPLGFLRDAIGLFAPVLNASVDGAADAIADAIIPIPDEELA